MDCVDEQSDANHTCGSCATDCTVVGAGVCNLGYCNCGPTGAGTLCSSVCTTLSVDPNNCGSCGNVCQLPASHCVNGMCACPDSDTLCGGNGLPLFCIDASVDPQNCGACGNVCDTSYAMSSACRFGNCTCILGTTTLCGTAR